MSEALISKMRSYALSQPQGIPCSVATEETIKACEKTLGFSLSDFLKKLYLQIGNGGFGRGLFGTMIGLQGGYRSDFGELAATYHQLKDDCESEGGEWTPCLLPFFEWGCNTFSCVQCDDPDCPIWTFKEGDVGPTGINIIQFCERLNEGADLLTDKADEPTEIEGINPFTGKKVRLKRRRSR